MHVTSLHIYPIKSCRGHDVESLTSDHLGPVGDRRLMLVDARGRFLSQRENPRLATITPLLDGDAVIARAPGREPLCHDLTFDGAIRSVTVWGSEGLQAVDQGDVAAAWFSSAIGQPCRLVRFGPMTRRPIDPDYSPRDGAETSFTDGYPVLAVTEASLEALNGRLATPVPMGRFRPTVVVGGAVPWAEDGWRVVTIGQVTLDAVKPCARCVVITTDQSSGARAADQEPLRTLAAIHSQPGRGAIFGQNMVARGPGVIRIGDAVRPA